MDDWMPVPVWVCPCLGFERIMKWKNFETEQVAIALANERSLPSFAREHKANNRWLLIAKVAIDELGSQNAAAALTSSIRGAYIAELKYVAANRDDLHPDEVSFPIVDAELVDWLQVCDLLVEEQGRFVQ